MSLATRDVAFSCALNETMDLAFVCEVACCLGEELRGLGSVAMEREGREGRLEREVSNLLVMDGEEPIVDAG